MTEPYHSLEIQNPDASAPLKFKVTANVPLEQINENVRVNSKLPYPWVYEQPERERDIVIVGGGPSMAENFEVIKDLRDRGAFVLAINGASGWLSAGMLFPDTQLIIDAKQETSQLVDLFAKSHAFASQVHPDTIASVSDVIMFHLASPGVEDHLPEGRRNAGGYTLIGGGAAAGNSALALAYALGYRRMHIFGLDSSFKDGQSHAYAQPMNDDQHRICTRFGDRAYWTTFPMKLQADFFLSLSAQLKQMGCELRVYGDGLLQDMYWERERVSDERSKYEYIWKHDRYGNYSPAVECVEHIANFAPVGPILDIGCGTGDASVELARMGYEPLLTDIAENSKRLPAHTLSFMQWDWSKAPLDTPYEFGFCCDVMEHIPSDDVHSVLKNIRMSCENVFFRIEFEPDAFGPALLGSPLHLSVHDATWWKKKLHEFWPSVEARDGGVFIASAETW